MTMNYETVKSGTKLTLKIVHTTEIDAYVRSNHYLHTTPAGAVLRMEFLDENNRRIGAMLWGRNPSPKQEQRGVLCLTRMYFQDDTEPYIESRALAMARKYIRKHLPEVKGVVSYASIGEGHAGTVYKADGWFEVSRSRANARDCRSGRKNIDTSAKIKFVRSV